MKLIAASIMTFAGAILLVGGAHVQYEPVTRLFVMAVGTAVVLTGLGGWFAGIREK